MSPPLVSILVPCYNAAPWLAATLESALAQTWPHIEIIVVDDGSRDDSLAIARGFEARGVHVIAQPNRGQCAAFNRALAMARGDYFEYLDADDLLAPDKIARQLSRLAGLPPGTVASGAWARFTDDPVAARFEPSPLWRDLSPVDWLVTAWEGAHMMHGAAWLVPRAVAERAGPWNEELSLINDFDYFARILLASEGAVFCGDARTFYRSGLTTSLSNAKSVTAWRSAFRAMQLGSQALLAREDSPRTRHAAATAFQRLIHSFYPQAPELLPAVEAAVRDHGGSEVRAEGGRMFLLLARLVGWKAARHLQLAWLGLRGSKS